jgi:hypothetical protein
MRLDFTSVVKAGAVAVVINIILGILGALPFVGPFFWVCTCFGGILIPILAGVLYGYFAPGKEDMGQAAVGGGLAGAAAGMIYGLVRIITTAAVALFAGDALGDIFVSGALDLFGTFCGALIFGGILGAVGGVLWIFFQGRNN